MSCINFIPLEITEAILLRLPVKYLGRFKSVSKEWNSIISDPRFVKTYNHLNQTKKKLLAISRFTNSLYSIELSHDITATRKEITFGSPPPIQWEEILGSCNGLLLARDVNWVMFLINPATHDLWKLPLNPFADYYDKYYASYGFGYDSSTDDYKVVSIYRSSRSYISHVDSVCIYSLRNNSWRKLLDNPHNDYNIHSCALVDGNCHWLAKNSAESIIAFSFVDELISEIKLPDSILNINYRYISMVVEIGGRLGVNLCLWSRDYELWVMQEYGDAKSWTRVFSHKGYMRPLCFLQGSNRDIVFEDSYGGGVVVFNIEKRRDRKVRITGGPSHFNSIGATFVESIQSIKRIITTP